MKATIPYKRIENTLFAIIPLLVGWRITSYYTSALPDFDIAANDIFITIECKVQTFLLWGIMLFFFYVIGKQVNNIRKSTVVQDNCRVGILVNRVGYLLLPMCHRSGAELE